MLTYDLDVAAAALQFYLLVCVYLPSHLLICNVGGMCVSLQNVYSEGDDDGKPVSPYELQCDYGEDDDSAICPYDRGDSAGISLPSRARSGMFISAYLYY